MRRGRATGGGGGRWECPRALTTLAFREAPWPPAFIWGGGCSPRFCLDLQLVRCPSAAPARLRWKGRGRLCGNPKLHTRLPLVVAVSRRPAARLARARAPAEFPVSVGSDFVRREEARVFCLRPNPAALPSSPSHEEEEMENAWEPGRCHIASPNHPVLNGPPFLPISYPNFPACATVKLVHL